MIARGAPDVLPFPNPRLVKNNTVGRGLGGIRAPNGSEPSNDGVVRGKWQEWRELSSFYVLSRQSEAAESACGMRRV